MFLFKRFDECRLINFVYSFKRQKCKIYVCIFLGKKCMKNVSLRFFKLLCIGSFKLKIVYWLFIFFADPYKIICTLKNADLEYILTPIDYHHLRM